MQKKILNQLWIKNAKIIMPIKTLFWFTII